MEIINLKQLKNDFQSAIDNSTNQKFLIETELNGILDYVKTVPNVKSFQNKVSKDNSKRTNVIFNLKISNLGRDLFNTAFHQILNTGNFEVSRNYFDTSEMFEYKETVVDQALEFSKYYEWLKTLSTIKAKQTVTFNHEEKLLALLYLGLDTKSYDNSKTAKILSAVLGMSEQNTRDHLSYLYFDAVNNPVRTKKHLENVSKQFENQGLTEISEKIKTDIKNLK